MIPWIQVYSNLITHPKTSKLADLLGITSKDVNANVVATGLLVSLWTWAVQNAYNGDLSECSDRAIAEAARYKKRPDRLVQALLDAGWLDADRKLHDWEEYASLIMEQEDNRRKKTRERVRRYRQGKKANVTPNGNAIVTVTGNECNAPTKPNQTLHNSNISASNTVDGIAPPQGSASFDGKPFTAFWEAYPRKIAREEAWDAWKALKPDGETAQWIMAGLDGWKKSDQWQEDGGRFIPGAAKFLAQGHWKCPPAPAKKNAPKGAPRELCEEELESIQRMLREDPICAFCTSRQPGCDPEFCQIYEQRAQEIEFGRQQMEAMEHEA